LGKTPILLFGGKVIFWEGTNFFTGFRKILFQGVSKTQGAGNWGFLGRNTLF